MKKQMYDLLMFIQYKCAVSNSHNFTGLEIYFSKFLVVFKNLLIIINYIAVTEYLNMSAKIYSKATLTKNRSRHCTKNEVFH